MNNKLWSGRFKETTNKLVQEFTASIPYDWKLYKYDIASSIAHARMLAKKGIKTNVTLVFSVNQALLAAKAGAAFVSPFIGRLDDIGEDGMALIRQIVPIYRNYGFKTQVLVASVRSEKHVVLSAEAGADVATIPPEIMEKMFLHKLTDAGIKKFLDDWNATVKSQGKK